MLVDPMYYAIFFDVDKPQTHEHALNKRIEYKTYRNLTDSIEGKQVELHSDKVATYQVISVKTFNICNTKL